MQKIRALASRGSGRVVPPPPPARRASTSGQDIRGSNSSQQFLLPPQRSAAPEEHGGRVAARNGSTNALATLGKKIFGSHHHRRHHNASSKNGDGSAREDPNKKKRQSVDLIGVYSRPRPRAGEDSFMSGGTSLMDMQALAHANRTTSGVLARHDDTPDPFAGDLTPRRRASEIVRELDSVLGCFLPDASEGVITGSTSAPIGHGIEQAKGAKAEDRAGRRDSIEPSPPTPEPRCPLRSPSPKPRRHQRKRSQSSFVLPTSCRVDQRIINHSDLDLCILLGNIARRNRGIRVTPPRKRQACGKAGLPPPPPPRCPAAADVFIVDDTVKRNRKAAMDALTARARNRREKIDGRGLVRSPKIEENLAQVVDALEGPAADEDADVATVRGWTSLPGLLQLCSPAPEDVDPYATVKRRGNTKEKDAGLQSRFSQAEPKKQQKIRLSPLDGFLPPAKPWKFKDLEKLPCVEPADRIAGIVRWVADVQEALALEAVLDVPYTAKVPQPYVPYWHFP
ncbi:hypothetical protein FRC00_012404 [Tulasnella sp. 408]|nr:hypothetical protein FRC00_012404 [Tulasnella sp. 408]